MGFTRYQGFDPSPYNIKSLRKPIFENLLKTGNGNLEDFRILYRTRCMCCSLSDAVAAGHPLSSSWEPQAGHGVPRQRFCFNFLLDREDMGRLQSFRLLSSSKHHPNIYFTLTFIGPHGASNEWLDPYKTLKGISSKEAFPFEGFPFEGCVYCSSV